MLDKKFGNAGNTIVIEEFMTDVRFQFFLCRWKTIKIMTSAQDHKRAKDGDKGLNTEEWEHSHQVRFIHQKLMNSGGEIYISGNR